MTTAKLYDIATRAGWTAAQGAVSLLYVEFTNVSTWWALPLATGLSAVKTWLVSHNKTVTPPAPGA